MDPETKAFMREVAEESAEKAVRRFAMTLGIDADNPLEVQKDLAALREFRTMAEDREFQRDMLHLRKWRKAMDAVESKGFGYGILFMVLGAIALAIVGIKTKFFPGV